MDVKHNIPCIGCEFLPQCFIYNTWPLLPTPRKIRGDRFHSLPARKTTTLNFCQRFTKTRNCGLNDSNGRVTELTYFDLRFSSKLLGRCSADCTPVEAFLKFYQQLKLCGVASISGLQISAHINTGLRFLDFCPVRQNKRSGFCVSYEWEVRLFRKLRGIYH